MPAAWVTPTVAPTTCAMKSPIMRTPALSTVFLDDRPIGLLGDPRPTVSKILAAGGRRSAPAVLARQPRQGRADLLGPDDIIDRTTNPAQPIFLVCRPGPIPAGATKRGERVPLLAGDAARAESWRPWPSERRPT